MNHLQAEPDTTGDGRAPAGLKLSFMDRSPPCAEILRTLADCRDATLSFAFLTAALDEMGETASHKSVQALEKKVASLSKRLDQHDGALAETAASHLGAAWRKIVDCSPEAAVEHLEEAAAAIAGVLIEIWPSRAGAVIH